jgi:hypothetical protein
MTPTLDTAPRPPGVQPRAKYDSPILAATSLTFIKRRLKAMARPLALKLVGAGVTANQVTLRYCFGHRAVHSTRVRPAVLGQFGGVPCFPNHPHRDR